MWSLFGLRKDSKKSTPDKEVDGGFVVVGEKHVKIALHIKQQLVTSHSMEPVVGPPAVEAPSTLPDLLMDVPFTLAPHVLAMQAGFPLIPDVLLSRDINYNLASFQYDFTLENSILHSA
uniref:UBAP1-MVB12-associated (UMA) domain containing 1 n=1 Tax=Amphilophus citrinellus TaxID=61819 RepID=A0A3Q0QX41_AMPCI